MRMGADRWLLGVIFAAALGCGPSTWTGRAAEAAADPTLLTVGAAKKQIMKYGLDYERLWFWYGSTANKNQVAQWSVVDCEIDYMRVAINCAYELTEGDYDRSAYTDKIIPMMSAMQAANPTVKFFASPRPLNEAVSGARWQPYPTWITGDTGSSFSFDWQKCAEYLERYIRLMNENGFRIHFMDLTNEWNYVTPTHVRNISDYLQGVFGDDMPLIVAPSAWSFSQGVGWLNGANTTSKKAAIDIAACHNTGKQGTPQDFADKAISLGKEVWDSEVHGWKGGTPADEIPTSFQMFDRIRAGFTGLDAWLTIGTTSQKHCYILNNGSTVTRNVKYYIFQKLCNTSNYGRALDINQPDAFTSTAALIRENLLTVWVLNTSAQSQPVQIDVGDRVIADGTVRQTRWNEAIAIEGVGSTFAATSVSLVDARIEPDSLHCFEITLEPTGADFPFLEAENYSDMSGIAVQPCTDAGGGEMVAFPNPGDEVAFEVDVTRPGDYDIGFRVASAAANIQFDLYHGTNRVATADRIATGHNQNWTTFYRTVPLPGGSTTLKIRATGGRWNLNWLECSPVKVASATENLALDQPASASNVHSAGYEADRAVDGNSSTRWATAVPTPWLEVDFGTATPVNAVSILDYGNRINAYEILYYDGRWKPAFTGGNPEDGQRYSFPTVTGTQLRLQVTASSGSPSIWEFEIYYDPSAADPGPATSMALGANAVTLSWSGILGSTYAVQRSTNLATDTFIFLEEGVPAQETTNTTTLAIPDESALYRVIRE